VVADLGLDPGRRVAPVDHGMGVGQGEGRAGELAGAAADGLEQRVLRTVLDPVSLEIGEKRLLKIMVAGHGVILAALLVQPDPQPLVMSEHVLDLHSQGGAYSGKAINYKRDERAIEQSHRRRDVNRVQQRPLAQPGR